MTMRLRTIGWFSGLMVLVSVFASAADSLPVNVAPTSTNLHFVGRFDGRDPAGPWCGWPGSEVALHFRGTAVNVKLREQGNDYFQVVVDGTPTTAIATTKTESLYSLASGLPDAEHTVELIKRTETTVGKTQFQGFELAAGGAELPWTRPAKHRFLYLGDSITCGYSIEGKTREERFSLATENNYLTYAAVTSRRFDGEYTCIAWSGRKMWPDRMIPSIWDLTIGSDPTSKYDLSQFKPEVIVINLATNDFWGDLPDEAKWDDAYETFIKTSLRSVYPDAQIFLCNGVMLIKPRDKMVRENLDRVATALHDQGDAKVHVVTFPLEKPEDGWGSDRHPNIKTHTIMADILTAAIAKELGWTPIELKTPTSAR